MVLGTAEQAAFDGLKQALLEHAVLLVPDQDKQFILHTDASLVGIGATLSQEDDAGNLRLVITQAQPGRVELPVHEKEMLSLIDALGHW